MSKATKTLAHKILAHPHVKRVLDKANEDHDCFAQLLENILDDNGVYQLPDSVQHALNSGDGVYRP